MESKLKKYGLDKIILIVLAGILLLLLALPQNQASNNQETVQEEEGREERLIRILEKKYGEGNIDVLITESGNHVTYFGEEDSGAVTGVLVLVRTERLEAVSYDIVEIITALYDVPAHKVVVTNMK